MKPVWAVVKVVSGEGKVAGYEVEKTIASCPAKTTSADGGKRIVLKKFPSEDEAKRYQEKVTQARGTAGEEKTAPAEIPAEEPAAPKPAGKT